MIKKLIPVFIKQTILDLINDLKYFNLSIAYSRMMFNLFKNEKLLNKSIVKYIENNYKYLIDKYNNIEKIDGKVNKTIWVLWLQGEENMPDIIKLCTKSKMSKNSNYNIVVLSEDNIKEYVHLPEYIWNQYESGFLRIQHLADIIRIYLIKEYGGLWLDASIFCHGEIPEEYFNMDVYSIKTKYDDQYISGNRWTTFTIGGKSNNLLCSFLLEFFYDWCKSGKPFIHYFMFDFAIYVAYKNILEINKQIEEIPMLEGTCYYMQEHIFDECTQQSLKEMDDNAILFNKIAWRDERYNQLDSDSIYAHFKNQYEIGDENG